jgi:adenine-specific DNA-methyltransferase
MVNSKKLTGEFFTPSSVVNFMIRTTFEHLLSRGMILDNNFVNFRESLLNTRFCDPAIGTGNFIIGLLKFIWKKIQSFENVSVKEQNNTLKKFIQENVFGVEIKKTSLDLCKERIVNLYPLIEFSDLKQIKQGNSLVELDAHEILNDKAIKKLLPFSWSKAFSEDIQFDVIIGNPPYFNLKKMILKDESIRDLYNYLKNSNRWKKYFRASSDIYYYFVIRSLELLNQNGILTFILPNYWIENKYADKLRELLLNNQLLDIYDFGQLNVFKDDGKWLNVSTCVMILEKTAPYQDIKIIRDIPRSFFRNYDVKTTIFYVNSSALNKEKWILSPYLDKIREIESSKDFENLSTIATVAQGMSPGVKSVFVLRKGEVENLGLETEVLVPFITNKNIKKWKPEFKNQLYAIMPSFIQDLEDYPNTMKYLQQHKEILTVGPDRKRLLKKNKIRWFDYSVYRNQELFLNVREKIITPYRSLSPSFCIDKSKSVGATDIYAIAPKNPKDIFNLLGILNSNFMEFWLREAGKKKGIMLEFFSDPLRKLPFPKKNRNLITDDVKDILRILGKSSNLAEIGEIEEEMNRKVAQMYNFDYNFLLKYQKEKK